MAALSAADRQAALDALIRAYPQARAVAIALSALIVPVPPNVPLNGQAPIEGIASMLDVVDRSQARTVIEAWDLMKEIGAATVSVSAWHDPDRVMHLHFVDMIDRYGVVICVVIGYEDGGRPPEPAALLPRVSVICKDELSRIISIDDAAVAILGWSAEELIGRRTQDLLHPDDVEHAIESWLRMLSQPKSTSQLRLRHRHRDGSWRWLEVTNHNNLAEPGNPHVLAEMVDVTAEVDAISALRTNERMLRRLAEALPIGVLYIEPDRRISYGNARLGVLSGVDPAEHLDAQLEYLVATDRDGVTTAIEAALRRGDDADIEVSFQVPGSRLRRCLMSLRPVTNDDDRVAGAITCLIDITEDANHREELERRVRYDPLTSCLNHTSIMAELQRQLDDPQGDTWTAVIFIDLDDFKETNDRFGHLDGDRLLKHVASQLWQVAGDGGLVGRVGGDEFLMVVRVPAQARTLTGLATGVSVALDRPITVQGESITPRASIGVAYARGAGHDVAEAAELAAAADAAMYQSKRRGDGTPVIAGLNAMTT